MNKLTMNDIHVIGNGACFSDLPNTSFYMILNNTAYIFECNMDTMKFIYTNYHKVFSQCEQFVFCISHLHEDHVGGLCSSLYALKYSCDIDLENVCIVSPDENKTRELCKIGAPDISSITFVDDDHCYFCYGDDDITISKFDVNHCEGMKCQGFKIDINNHPSLIYTGDSSELSDDIVKIINDGDAILVGEVTLSNSPVHCNIDEYCNKISYHAFTRILFVHYDNSYAMSLIIKYVSKKMIEQKINKLIMYEFAYNQLSSSKYSDDNEMNELLIDIRNDIINDNNSNLEKIQCMKLLSRIRKRN